MSIISLSDIEKSYGALNLFRRLTISFHWGQRVGLTGPNGCGKTTLFRLIIGQEYPDKGVVSVQKGLRLAYLPQENQLEGSDQKTVFETAFEGIGKTRSLQNRLEEVLCELDTQNRHLLKQKLSEYESIRHQLDHQGGWNAEILVKSILSGLGLNEETYSRPVSALSGGQLSRLMLARTLVSPSDVLLLDEPTNHLDLQGIEWLEMFLKNYKGTVLLISHDRYFLDQLADSIVEIEAGQAVCYRGNYTSFLEQKKVRRLSQERILRRRKEFIAKTLDFIARNKDQEGMRKTARGRKTRLRRLLQNNPDFLKELPEAQRISFFFESLSDRREKLIRAESLSKRFGETVLFRNLSIELTPGCRTVIIGPNGSGKTTLLKILLGHLEPDEGSVQKGENIRIGYLDQHAQTLCEEKTVLEEAAAVRPDLSPEQLRGKLAAFLFRGEQVFQPIAALSGGQKNRLMLAKLVLAEPELLILDEPTNHLDMESRQVLEEALAVYEGAVLAVSHDRYFINRLFDSMLILGRSREGQVSPAEHTWYHKFAEEEGIFTQWIQRAQTLQQKTTAPPKNSPSGTIKKPPSVSTPPEIRRFNAWKLEDIEEKILSLEEEIESLSLQYGKEETYRNKEAVRSLQENLDRKKSELVFLYRAYEWRIEKKKSK